MSDVTELDGVALAHRDVFVNGVRLHFVEAGDADGPLVVLLHGFPEFWYGWRRQIPALARAGFRVIAPDQRGYNTSAKPAGAEAYTFDQLSGDVAGLIAWAGRERACIVGHDWGGVVAWWTAITRPQVVERLAILNVPHPKVFRDSLRGDPRQTIRSLYAAFFQLPLLPELLLAGGEAQGAMMLMQATSNPGSFTDADVPHYLSAFQQPRAMTSMLNWYRAVVRYPPSVKRDPSVRMPVLIQWGMRDVALTSEMAAHSLRYCAAGRLISYENATHWLQHDEPEAVNRELLAFFGGGDGG